MRCAAVFVLLAVPAVAGDHPETGREFLNGTLWMQKAAEYRLVAEQAYAAATAALDRRKEPGTASWEQAAQDPRTYEKKPLAVILDIDETVLDNSPYQARALADGAEYERTSWDIWVREKKAPAIPGAMAFINTVLALTKPEVKVFYITNRECPAVYDDKGWPKDCPHRTATMERMKELGFHGADDPSVFLLANGKDGWGSMKEKRRAYVAETHRIIALVGDDLRDFVEREVWAAKEPEIRKAVEVGKRWFVLPNPLYGSWERAVAGRCEGIIEASEACREKKLDAKYRALEPAR